MRAQGIEVAPGLLADWAAWFAPRVQPFPLPDGLGTGELGTGELQPDNRPLPDELRDTFHLYGESDAVACAWLDEAGFLALAAPTRAALANRRRAAEPLLVPSTRSWPELRDRVRGQVDGHRFIWWPSLLARREERVLLAYLEDGCPPDRHTDVDERTWDLARPLLPGARALAGRFPAGSGPNCFATVMGAAGSPVRSRSGCSASPSRPGWPRRPARGAETATSAPCWCGGPPTGSCNTPP